MINILLALLFSTLIMVTFKLFDRFRIDTLQAITFNYLVAVVSGVVSYKGALSPAGFFSMPWFQNGLLIGCFFIAVFFVFATSSRRVGIAITAVSSKMSVVIPVLAGVFLLKNDHLTIIKVIGIILALIAFYLTFKKKEKINLSKGYFVLPVLLFLGNGTNDTLMSYTSFTHQTNQLGHTTPLLIVVFTTALLIGSAIMLGRYIIYRKGIQGRNVIAGIILGLFNYLSTYYFFRSLNIYPNSVFFPVFNAGIVSLSAITGFLVFREKLRVINWIGIVAAILAIIVIALAGDGNV
jgi:drug/metabolite transporter (DMT)-like permease